MKLKRFTLRDGMTFRNGRSTTT